MYINALFLLLYINYRYTEILSVQFWKFMGFPPIDLRQNFILDLLVADSNLLEPLPCGKSWIIFKRHTNLL